MARFYWRQFLPSLATILLYVPPRSDVVTSLVLYRFKDAQEGRGVVDSFHSVPRMSRGLIAALNS